MAFAKTDCLVSYDAFREGARNIAMENCPGDWADADEFFCRLTLEKGRATVYIFEAREGKSACLTRARSWSVEAFFRRFGDGF